MASEAALKNCLRMLLLKLNRGVADIEIQTLETPSDYPDVEPSSVVFITHAAGVIPCCGKTREESLRLAVTQCVYTLEDYHGSASTARLIAKVKRRLSEAGVELHTRLFWEDCLEKTMGRCR